MSRHVIGYDPDNVWSILGVEGDSGEEQEGEKDRAHGVVRKR